MALKYVAVQSGGYDVTDPVSVRKATRPSTWPQIPISSEILDNRVYLLFDATGAYCLPQFQLTFTGAVECKMHLYKDTTLFRTDTVALTSGSYNTTQYNASVDYNYVLVEISGGTITQLIIASGSNLSYDNTNGNVGSFNQLLEVSGKLDSLTNCVVTNSYNLRYFGLKKSDGVYTCSLSSLDSLIAVLDYNSNNPTFSRCSALISIPQLNKISTNMFQNCYSLTEIPLIDTSSVADMTGIFDSCFTLKTIPPLNTSNVTIMSSMFRNCYSLTKIPQLDTSSVTSMSFMFRNCYSLTKIPQLDTSSVTDMSTFLNNCSNLVSINGTVIRKSTSLSSCRWMPHDELVEIIGNLPDLTGSTAQTLTLGATLLAKLSADEIAVATNKNWTVN